MRPALDPAAPVLRRDLTHLQVGTDPHDAVVLRDLPEVTRLLRRCDGVRDEAEVLAGTGQSGPGGPHEGDPDQSAHGDSSGAQVLTALLDAGALIDVDAAGVPGRAPGETARLVGLGMSAARAHRTVAARRHSTVGLLGPEPVVEPLVALLGACGARPERQAKGAAADLMVVVGYPEPDRDRLDALARDDVDHLVGALHPHSAQLGPLVRPGRTACVRCADAARADTDPAWAVLVTQLGSPLQRSVLAPAATPLLVATLVAAIAGAVLAWLDGTPAAGDGAVLRWGADCTLAGSTPLSPHPRCGCIRVG